MGKSTHNAAERFLANIEVAGSGCWLWTAYRDPGGYGRFSLGDGIFMLAHRYSYALHRGELPKASLICHTCDNPPCVNPAHLYAGSPVDNMGDMIRRKRAPHANLTERAVKEIRRRYAAGGITQRELASAFGVSQPAISYLVNRRNRAHIT